MKKLIKQIFAWLFIALILFGLLFFLFKQSLFYSLIDPIVSVSIFAILTFGIKHLAKFVELDKNLLSKFLITHLFAGVFISIIWLTGTQLIIDVVFPDSVNQNFFDQSIYFRFTIGILVYFLITAFNYLFLYYENYKEKLLKEAELKNLVTEAELKTLKFQINPHFIFNSLNSIAALTSIDSGKAKDMTIKLADFLRFTLSNDNKKMNSLGEEILNLRRYLEIEKVRFEEKIIYVENVTDEVKSIQVPNMILQPIVENAVKYGVYEAVNPVTISLNVEIENDFLKLIIENSVEDSKSDKKGEGVGLKNIQERLKLIYNQPGLITLQSREDIFRVLLYIPIEKPKK